MTTLRTILLNIWEFLGKNKDQIAAISQTALVIGGVFGLYKYFTDDRQHRRQAVAQVSETWIENADALVEIDNRWISRVAQLIQILQPPQEIPGISGADASISTNSSESAEEKKRRTELENKIESLPIVLNKCLEKDECDETRLVNQFCAHIYKLGMLYDFKYLDNDRIASAIRDQLEKL
jgi:hypothetical protein